MFIYCKKIADNSSFPTVKRVGCNSYFQLQPIHTVMCILVGTKCIQKQQKDDNSSQRNNDKSNKKGGHELSPADVHRSVIDEGQIKAQLKFSGAVL